MIAYKSRCLYVYVLYPLNKITELKEPWRGGYVTNLQTYNSYNKNLQTYNY